MSNPRNRFLARVDELTPGRGDTFAPLLDALVAWSRLRHLEYVPCPADRPVVQFGEPGSASPLWTAAPQARIGAVLVLMAGPGFDAAVRCRTRVALAGLDGRPVDLSRPPELAFARLAWAPCREAVLTMLAGAINPPAAALRVTATRTRRRTVPVSADSTRPERPGRL